MGFSTSRYDVIIVGAGTAGAAAALHCARRGLRTLCLDRRDLEEAGARWVNGVPRWAFEEAGIAPPVAPELREGKPVFHMLAGKGPQRVTMRDHEVLDVDMRALVSRLQRDALAAGAELQGHCKVEGLGGDRLETSEGPVAATTFVDASGLSGAGLMTRPPTPREDLCVAAQWVHEVRDHALAAAFFAEHEVSAGETLCFTGIAGGYSILNLRLEGDELSFLAGSIPALGYEGGGKLIEHFLATHDFVGERRFGGTRAIPLQRPLDRLAEGSVALLGDAASQVFSAHGSGIGSGMIAARVLAEALADGAGPQGYAVRWQRRWGGLHAAYDVFRRLSETLSVDALARLIGRDLLDTHLSKQGLEQRMPSASLLQLLAKLPAALLEPRFTAQLGLTAARMQALQHWYRRYPEDPAALPAWSKRARQLAGEPARSETMAPRAVDTLA